DRRQRLILLGLDAEGGEGVLEVLPVVLVVAEVAGFGPGDGLGDDGLVVGDGAVDAGLRVGVHAVGAGGGQGVAGFIGTVAGEELHRAGAVAEITGAVAVTEILVTEFVVDGAR